MSEEFYVPKHCVTAELRLPDCPAMDVDLFLGERAERHTGRERPSDLLNGAKRFFPVRTRQGDAMLVRREAVLTLSFSAEVLGPDPGIPGGPLAEGEEEPADLRRVEVTILLDDDIRVTGEVAYVLPRGEQRLQDFLNRMEEPFFRVWEGERVHLVNREHVVRIRTSGPD